MKSDAQQLAQLAAELDRAPFIMPTMRDLYRLMAAYPQPGKDQVARAWGKLQLHLWNKPQNTPCN